ncbi:thioredoxin domain-containing protein [Edaphobacter paludis]|uniref:Thioredoxin domain-containing protein n=1 Tax=Edaphobacter paludis TaxID=3035702 RepID=A0AAU7CVS7_9BACT
MKISKWMLAGLASVLSVAVVAGAQTGTTGTAPKTNAPAPALHLNDLGQTVKADPFPPANPKYFTAPSPTVDTVNAFLKALWGYDDNRIWRVEAIQTTAAPGVSKVVVFISDKSPNAKVQTAAFFVTPDGNHVIAGDGVVPFGATPFAELRKILQTRADGASRGAASKDLLLVEFADLECPHCKEAQATMDQLVKDFPNARVVFQSFPLAQIHPFAFKAAAYGYCVQKQKNDAFFTYASAVFDTQAGLTAETADATLKNAVTKAGLDPAAIDACAATPAIKEQVNASIKLAEDVGVNQTPELAVNGHLLPISQVPYETLKKIIAYQAQLDGVSTGASASTASAPSLAGK